MRKGIKLVWDRRRFFQHIPVGLGTALTVNYNPHLAWMMFLGFALYECLEEWRSHDLSFKDVQGWLTGIFMGLGLLYLLNLS